MGPINKAGSQFHTRGSLKYAETRELYAPGLLTSVQDFYYCFNNRHLTAELLSSTQL